MAGTHDPVSLGRSSQLTEAKALANKLIALVDELSGEKPPPQRITVRTGGRVIFVELDRIDWVEAEGNYVRLHLGPESYLIRETMNALAARLGNERFFRIHRSRIVNIARIKELRLAPGGDYDVVLDTGSRLGLSRLQRGALQARLVSRGF
jgi:two-component system LytT family response regulator